MGTNQTVELYVKPNNSYPNGLELSSFELLSPTWSAERVRIQFYAGGEQPAWKSVVGWSSLLWHVCEIHVVKARTRDAQPIEGYLVYGGDFGVRVLDRRAPKQEEIPDEFRGYGYPYVWVEAESDLPNSVQTVVSQSLAEG